MREFRIIEGDALAVLRTLPSESVNCCISSPPYWGLRDYGTAQWEGGDAGCDHTKAHSMATSGLEGGKTTTMNAHYWRDVCGKCGARRIDAQIGLERTPEEYCSRLVAVFREVRRVLRADGTAWVNLGDSYAAHPNQRKTTDIAGPKQQTNAGSSGAPSRHVESLKPKDLVGIPWRVAFALQADGWYLRSDIIWAKPNPMPESVSDRPTKAHEYIFLLAKSERYWYDIDAIREAHASESLCRTRNPNDSYGNGEGNGETSVSPFGSHELGRNRRTVWTQSTQPYAGAHFATWPEELIRPCVLAGCPLGGVVLDPFCGSGTSGVVALGLDRGFVGIELNPQYCEMARGRIAGDQPLFNTEAEQEVRCREAIPA